MSLLPACTLCRRRTIQRRLSNRHKEMGKKMRREYSFNSWTRAIRKGEARPSRRPSPGKGTVMYGKTFQVLCFNSKKKEKTSW